MLSRQVDWRRVLGFSRIGFWPFYLLGGISGGSIASFSAKEGASYLCCGFHITR